MLGELRPPSDDLQYPSQACKMMGYAATASTGSRSCTTKAANWRCKTQERQSRIMHTVRAAEAEEQARAQAELQRRQAFEQLQERFGGQLTSALIRLGTAAEQVRREFIATFGPAVASLVDGITGFIERNRGALTGLFQDIQRQFAALGGDAQLGTVLQTLLDLGRQAASMITGALIPAFQTFMGFLDRVAFLINAAFGTEMTGKQILMAGIILKLAGVFAIVTGAIRSAFAVLSLLVALFGPWGLAIAGVVAGLSLLAAAVDWQGLFNAARAALDGGVARVLGWTGHLNIGNESFALRADDRATADRLVRFAMRKQTARAGRMPGYFWRSALRWLGAGVRPPRVLE
jgi:hypothetical protein